MIFTVTNIRNIMIISYSTETSDCTLLIHRIYCIDLCTRSKFLKQLESFGCCKYITKLKIVMETKWVFKHYTNIKMCWKVSFYHKQFLWAIFSSGKKKRIYQYRAEQSVHNRTSNILCWINSSKTKYHPHLF